MIDSTCVAVPETIAPNEGEGVADDEEPTPAEDIGETTNDEESNTETESVCYCYPGDIW
jgi:hypothetical protein